LAKYKDKKLNEEVSSGVTSYNDLTDKPDLSSLHTQNTDTGTTGNTFTIDSDSTTGKMVLDVTLNTGQNRTMTITNEAMTADRTITLPNETGTVSLTSHDHNTFYAPLRYEILQLDEGMSPYAMLSTNIYMYSLYVRGGDLVIDLPTPTEVTGQFIYIHITRLDSPQTLTIQHIDSSFSLVLSNTDQDKMVVLTSFNNDAFAGYKVVNFYP